MEILEQAKSAKTACTLSDSIIRRIRYLTAINDHGQAYVMAAKALGDDELALKFERINRIHTEHGELSAALNTERYGVYQELMAAAKKVLAPATYNAFYQSM